MFTTPGEVNGTFVIDGVVGDWLCAKFGSLRENPLTIQVKGNRLTEAHSANRELEDDFWRYTHTDENSDRVGEFAIGTNIELKDVIGQILQDEKYPGIHIAFGNPYGAHTGAQVGLFHPHRRCRQKFRHLGGRRADHAQRAVSAGSVGSVSYTARGTASVEHLDRFEGRISEASPATTRATVPTSFC